MFHVEHSATTIQFEPNNYCLKMFHMEHFSSEKHSCMIQLIA